MSWAGVFTYLQLGLGVLILLLTLLDVFLSVVVPRWTSKTLRIAPHLIDGIWPLWRRLGMRLSRGERRENFLATFAPLALMLLLAAWVALFIFGYGLMLYALRNQVEPALGSLGDAFYFAGASLFTIGYGEIVATGGPARVVVLSAGAVGLAVVALVISLMFNLHSSFQRREVLVLTLDARAGAPPSGVTLLETAARTGTLDDLPDLFRAWEIWSAEVLESHRAHAILPYFRSSHNGESWISALGAVLDAATLLLTTVECGPQGAARAMHSLGSHAVFDISRWFGFRDAVELGVERAEFDFACARLERVGFQLRNPEEAWRAFAEMRSTYAGPVNEMARYFATPPAQWIGDRSNLPYHNHLLSEEAARERT